MESNHKLQGLGWLIEEIEASLQQASEALEAFVDDPEDDVRVRFCLSCIQQVRGSLQVVECHGPLILAEEMELLAGQLQSGAVNSVSEACDVLVQAILRLPAYVREVIASGHDQPETLLLLLNELRAVCGQPLVTESAFFSPQLSQPVETGSAVTAMPTAESLGNLLRKLRQMYQVAMLGVIKGDNLTQNFAYLEKVIGRLQALSKGYAQHQLWVVTQAFIENISDRSIPAGTAVKVLLREIDTQIKRLLKAGVAGFQDKPPEALLKNLLFYVAYGDSNQPVSLLVKEQYQLGSALPDGVATVGMAPLYQPEIAENIVRELDRELNESREKIERYMVQGGDTGLLQEASQIIHRMVGSLSVVGALTLRDKLNTARQMLDECESVEAATRQTQLELVAAELIKVEVGLQDWLEGHMRGISADAAAEQADMGQARETLLQEARNGLEAVREGIVEFIASQWDRTHLEKIPASINEIAGALEMLSMTRAQQVLRSCNSYLAEQLLSGEVVPDWNSLDALADTITSVEYYLEYGVSRAAEGEDEVLEVAENSLAELGYPVKGVVDNIVEGAVEVSPPESQQEPHQEPGPEVEEAIETDLETEVPADIEQEEDVVDPEIIEVFVEEVDEVLDSIAQNYPGWADNPSDKEPLTEIRRAFHTLKGSGRMVGAEHVGELSWAVENLLNKVLADQLDVTSDTVQLVGTAAAEIPPMIAQFQSDSSAEKDEKVDQLIEAAEALLRGEVVNIPGASGVSAGQEPEPDESPLETDEDRELHAVFAGEAEAHLKAVADFIAEQQREAPLYACPPSEVQRALHTLKGSALMAGISAIGDFVVPLEKFVKDLCEFQQPVDTEIVGLMSDGVGYIRDILQSLQQGQYEEAPGLQPLLERLEGMRQHYIEPLLQRDVTERNDRIDPASIQTLMVDGLVHLLDGDDVLHSWQQAPENREPLKALCGELTQLRAAADGAGLEPMASAVGQLTAVYSNIVENNGSPVEELLATLSTANNAVVGMLDCAASHQPCEPIDDELRNQLAELSETLPVETAPDIPEPITIEPLDSSDIDTDILQTFLEEADELMEGLELALQSWSADKGNASYPEQIKRVLHTLKGGGRMAGLTQLGDVSHTYEDRVEALVLAGKLPATEDFFELEQRQGVLQKILQAARDFLSGSPVPGVEQEVVLPEVEPQEESQPEEAQPEGEPPAIVSASEESSALDAIARAVAIQASQQPPTAAAPPAVKRQMVRHEVVKVPAPRLESLVNLAGETSIARGRIEQQISGFGSTLKEMDATIQRLQDQVRRIGVETDAQVLFRHEQIDASTAHEGFDPLEMDRYSQLQQLSRSLLESVSDIQDLKETLANKSRAVESQLVEQARINTDLQESMMQTRMVPFSRIVPRLRRMVRQLGDELGKKVKLKVAHVDGEMDRSVMENALAPLEHMLRNSLDHGIEAAEQRTECGKPEQGTITIGMMREGSDILIRLSDDGRGIDLEAVRQKAIEKGLVPENTNLDDQEILQFIFQSGLSTSEAVSQVSGRGVGMDVANNQIRQLGGSIEVMTRKGEGTQFTIRLPFTVSVNRALMVAAGEEIYALPLNAIDGVVRINPAELEHYYRFPDSRLEYAGGRYQVRYMGSLLQDGVVPKIDLDGQSVVLVLVHSETRLYAVQIDDLLDTSEVVVKSLGPQFSAVPGLSGATIRGDGRVVVILDLLALLRRQVRVSAGVELLGSSRSTVEPSKPFAPTVMVVDDSVTVRKVTGRLLRREGFHVLTAKDGVDAMTQLQDHRPDVILLDIEMPRMDGFEMAGRLLHSENLKDIPVIMITSRTGEKHRERAEALGVKRYLGKPYQEDILLQSIDEVLNAVVA